MDFLKDIDPSWHDILKSSFEALDSDYLEYIKTSNDFFPNRDRFLSAFKTLSKDNTKYILFGQDPYPREESAIGYSFIDGKVQSLWSETSSLSKEVNKATSLRNFMKTLMLIDNKLDSKDLSKSAVESVDKSGYISSIYELKDNFESNGVLLLNISLIFESKEKTKYHTKMWKPFINRLLEQIEEIELILFGNIAKVTDKLNSSHLKKHYLEHPYNVSFITNPKSHELFGSMSLLKKQTV
jgi:uracil-DNA glycosylase